MSRRLLEHLNHELRSPMTVIVGMTDLLLLRTSDDEPRQCLQSVKRAADMLLRILDEAVDLSRLDAGTLALAQTEFALGATIERARAAISPLRLEATIDESVPDRLVGDAPRLEWLVTALVRSATKVRSASGYRLCIGAEPPAQGHVVLHFALGDEEQPFNAASVPDTGGRSLTVDDFFQRGFFGAGLGLPVSAGVAGLMNGRLWMADDGNSPVLFRCSAQFALPGSPAMSNLLEVVAARFAADEPLAARSMRVLLVEDTAANRQFFVSALEQRGHTAVGVGDGEDALAVFQERNAEGPFDVVLIDLEMPVMDGWQTAAALRELDAFRARPIPLVALTAHATNGEAKLSGPFDAAITKPCELAQLYDVVEGRTSSGSSLEPTAETADTRRLDRSGTLRRLAGNESLFHDLVRFFLEDAPTVLAELGTSLERDDAKIAERAAHSLKGLVGNFGAKEATRLATELQQLGHDGNLTAAAPLYHRLQTEVNLLRRELEAYQANSAHAGAVSSGK